MFGRMQDKRKGATCRKRQTIASICSGVVLAIVPLTACPASEARLSETQLYADIAAKTLADDIEIFSPQFPLWSDGVEKARYIRLPPGEQIDTSDMDQWVFPVGTELYKEFSSNGRRLETRLQRKVAEGDWTMVAYVWNEDQSDAEMAPLGASNIHEGQHDSPPVWDCAYCHGAPSKPLGFSAIQLNHDDEGLTLSKLLERDLLTHAPEHSFSLPGDDLDQKVLGALHVNCGSCHSGRGELRNLDLRLALKASEMDSVEDTAAYRTAVDVDRGEPIGGLSTFIAPGRPDQSLLLFRMSQRGNTSQMPPVGSERVDAETMNAFADWISRLSRKHEGEE